MRGMFLNAISQKYTQTAHETQNIHADERELGKASSLILICYDTFNRTDNSFKIFWKGVIQRAGEEEGGGEGNQLSKVTYH